MTENDPMNKNGLQVPNPEVVPKPKYRTFSLDYKRSIVEQAEACTRPGEIGALLRREGLYDSHLAKWRALFANAGRQGPQPARRGRKPVAEAEKVQRKELERLQAENARLQVQLKQAELIIDVQKKVSQLLGVALSAPPSDENT